MRNVHRVHVTDIWSWYRVELRVGDHLGRSEELVSRCIECDLAEPESLASLGGSAPGVVDGILSLSEFLGLLHSCDESPVLLLSEVTPHGIMEYASGHCHIWGGQGYLSKSAYGTICAAAFHLFCIHNCVGFSEIFSLEIYFMVSSNS